MRHPSEIPVPAPPALLAEKIRLEPVRYDFKDIVPAIRAGHLPSQEVGFCAHCVSFLGLV